MHDPACSWVTEAVLIDKLPEFESSCRTASQPPSSPAAAAILLACRAPDAHGNVQTAAAASARAAETPLMLLPAVRTRRPSLKTHKMLDFTHWIAFFQQKVFFFGPKKMAVFLTVPEKINKYKPRQYLSFPEILGSILSFKLHYLSFCRKRIASLYLSLGSGTFAQLDLSSGLIRPLKMGHSLHWPISQQISALSASAAIRGGHLCVLFPLDSKTSIRKEAPRGPAFTIHDYYFNRAKTFRRQIWKIGLFAHMWQKILCNIHII